MVIINAGCQGHAGDLAAAGLAQSVFPAESLFLLTALAILFSRQKIACMGKTCTLGRGIVLLLAIASLHSLFHLQLLSVPRASLWASCFHSHCARYWPAHRFPWSLVYLKQPVFPDLVPGCAHSQT